VGGQRHAPAALPPGKTRYLLYRRLSGPQGRSDWCRKSRPQRDSIPRPSSPYWDARQTELSRPIIRMGRSIHVRVYNVFGKLHDKITINLSDMNDRAYKTDLTVKCIIWIGNYFAICSRTEKEKNSSVATSIQQPCTQKQRDIPYGCPQACAAAPLLIIQYTTLNESHRCTVHFVKSLQLLTNKCTYITFT